MRFAFLCFVKSWCFESLAEFLKFRNLFKHLISLLISQIILTTLFIHHFYVEFFILGTYRIKLFEGHSIFKELFNKGDEIDGVYFVIEGEV